MHALAALSAVLATVTAPALEPRAIAFWDTRHGLVSFAPTRGCVRSRPGTVAETRDGGKTFRRLRSGCREALEVAPAGAAWTVLPGLLRRSLDAGRTWETVSRLPFLSVSFATAHAGLAIVSSPRLESDPDLRASTDGGRTWRRLRDPCDGVASASQGEVVSLATPLRGWIRCEGQPATDMTEKAIFSTTDGGRTWRLRARTGRPGRRVGEVPSIGYLGGMQFVPDGHGWMWLGRGDFLTTTDGGRRWRPRRLHEPDCRESLSASLVAPRQGFSLLFDCRTQRRSLLRSSDDGKTWQKRHMW